MAQHALLVAVDRARRKADIRRMPIRKGAARRTVGVKLCSARSQRPVPIY
jgi:hypothetical protein